MNWLCIYEWNEEWHWNIYIIEKVLEKSWKKTEEWVHCISYHIMCNQLPLKCFVSLLGRWITFISMFYAAYITCLCINLFKWQDWISDLHDWKLPTAHHKQDNSQFFIRLCCCEMWFWIHSHLKFIFLLSLHLFA